MSNEVILVTGGTSGVGLACCLALAASPNIHLLLVGHDAPRVASAVASVQQAAHPTTQIEGAVVDIGSLPSVRDFCKSLVARDLHLFSLVCNAGLSIPTKELTSEGFERAFAVNYLGHFLMIRLLQHRTQRVVTLGSETHDPALGAPTPPPNVSDLDQFSRGYTDFDGTETYVTTKLLTIAVAKAFARRFPDGPEILAYSPGFVPDTELYRHQAAFDAFQAAPFLQSKGIAVSTAAYSGKVLARVASADSWRENGWKSGDFISKDEVISVSKQAEDAAFLQTIWDKSEDWIAQFK